MWEPSLKTVRYERVHRRTAPQRASRATAWRALAASIFVAACGQSEPGPAPTPEPVPVPPREVASETKVEAPPLVILISIDTLRADHLGTYGYERFTSPMIDTFAAEGTVFEDASSAAPWTLPSHTTMLTGLYPLTHEVMTIQTHLDESRVTLPAMLRDAGYRTAAAVSTGWLRNDRYKVTKDFDDYIYVETKPWRRSPSTWITDQAIEWVESAGDDKLFVMLHYFDVHADYTSEPEYEALFVEPYDGPADGTAWQILIHSLEPEYIEKCRVDYDEERCTFGVGGNKKLVDQEFERVELGDADFRHLMDRYDAGIRQMDAEFGRFIAHLRKTGRLEDALIVVTSDHGEGFGEHGRLDHFLFTHQEVLHVPLIMRGPGIPAGQRVSAPVSLVDLTPTILDLTGASSPHGLEGLSLMPLIAGDEAPFRQRTMYGEAPGGLTYEGIVPGMFPIIRSIRRDRWKLVYDSKQDAFALYDLQEDPAETTDLASSKPAIARQLLEEMEKRYEGFTPSALENATVELSEEEKAELRALGYLP